MVYFLWCLKTLNQVKSRGLKQIAEGLINCAESKESKEKEKTLFLIDSHNKNTILKETSKFGVYFESTLNEYQGTMLIKVILYFLI